MTFKELAEILQKLAEDAVDETDYVKSIDECTTSEFCMRKIILIRKELKKLIIDLED